MRGAELPFRAILKPYQGETAEMKIVAGNILAIYRKELQGYFASPLAYAIAGVFWLLAGYLFVDYLLGPYGVIRQAALQDLQAQQLGGGAVPIDVPYRFLSNYLGAIGIISLFVLPMLSMGLYSEERKRGTLELLATSPITNWAVALGKLLGVMTFFGTMILPLLAYEALALSASNPPIKMAVPLLAHLGLLLLAGSVLSLGMFISSMTESTILSAIITFVLVFFLWVAEPIANNLGGFVGSTLSHLSLIKHYRDFLQGVFDTGGLILFISYIFLGLFLTAQTIDALRFNRS